MNRDDTEDTTIYKVWTDMRPLSLRRMGHSSRSKYRFANTQPTDAGLLSPSLN